MGNVLQAGLGQNPARQALLKSGLAETVCGFTVNKYVVRVLKVWRLPPGHSGRSGAEHCGGGMENMSLAPTYSMQKHALVIVLETDGFMT